MSGVVCVNGNWVPASGACVPVLDRGFLFSDAVYEVTAVLDGLMLDAGAHLERLFRSLAELGIRAPADRATLWRLQREAVARNSLKEGIVYLQVTRGVAERDFSWPDPDSTPATLVILVQEKALLQPETAGGVRIILVPDIRWQRCDIKTTSLVAACMARQQARLAGAQDAWLVDRDGMVTEGTASNACIVDRAGTLVTRPTDTGILAGTTRASVLGVAHGTGLSVMERRFSADEARNAAEAFQTSASGLVTPVTSIDGVPVGDGRPGPLASRLRELCIERLLTLAREEESRQPWIQGAGAQGPHAGPV